MSRPAWFVKLVKIGFPARFRLARLTKRIPLVSRVVEWAMFDGDHMVYLPKDTVVPIGRTIGRADNMVLPSQVLDHFIDNANYHLVMHFCICRDTTHCRDYPINLGCLFLGEAVLDIDPRLGRRVTKAEAHEHVRRCREAGLVHLIGRNKLDTVWLGAGPGYRLMTICHCCPCCCLWKVLPDLSPRIAGKVVRMPGVSVAVTDRCAGCGTCAEGVCFVDAIHLHGGRAVIDDDCRGCGRCVEVCPNRAIDLEISASRSVEASVAEISPLVDLS